MKRRFIFKDLTGNDIKYLRLLHADEDKSHSEKMREATARFGVQERAIRKWWQNLGLSNKRVERSIQLEKARKREIPTDTDVVLVCSCQNTTSANKAMLEGMVGYQKFLKEKKNKIAEILIIPTRYRNPTVAKEDEKRAEELSWCKEAEPYLYYGDFVFNNETRIVADAWIPATAKRPLEGYEILAANHNVVLGHSRIHFKTLPAPRDEQSKTMCTTGSLSYRNYSKSKAGRVAEEHHSYGFVVVEKGVIPRNVKVHSDGRFTDIVFHWNGEKVAVAKSCDFFVLGDLHSKVINKDFLSITKNLLCGYFRPKKVFVHDCLDGYSFNPHEEKDMYIQKKKIREGSSNIKREVEEALQILEGLSECSEELYAVESNHDVFLDRHINNANWKRDLYNSENYLEYALIQQTEDLTEHGTLFGFLVNTRLPENIKYIPAGRSVVVNGYEVGHHGDFGVNGAKGSQTSFIKLNRKKIHGHTHSPSLADNVTCVGVTADKRQHYNRRGYSSWMYAHSVGHTSGKNQLLVFTDDLKLTNLL